MKKIDETVGFFLFAIVLVGCFSYFKNKQDIRYDIIKETGRMAEGEIARVRWRKGSVKGVEYKYYNTYTSNCEEGSLRSDFPKSFFTPVVGERYKVFYDEEMAYISFSDYLIRKTDAGIEINNVYYKIPQDVESFVIEDVISDVCPDSSK